MASDEFGPNTRIPDNSLFKSHPESNSPYLVETDPRFTNKKQWLSSDYMMNAFITDPNNIQKRLGDGFYEQRLIREQVVALTGQRYIGNTQSDEEQYKMLMDIFQNRSGDLPQKPAGYYTEYVHPTNGITGPGPQRIVVGKSGEIFYTPDHYKTFIPIKK